MKTTKKNVNVEENELNSVQQRGDSNKQNIDAQNDQSVKIKKGSRIAYKNDNGIRQGKVVDVKPGDKLLVEFWDREKKQNLQEEISSKSTNAKIMRPGQEFDLRELHFPFLGKSLEEMKKHFPQLLYGKKTKVIENLRDTDWYNNKNDDITAFTGKVMLRRNTRDGKPYISSYRKEKSLSIPYDLMGVYITQEMKDKLKKEDHLGLVEGFEKGGRKFNAYVSVDHELNKLAVLPENAIHLSGTLKGKKLTDNQMNLLKKGEMVFVEGMKGANSKKFSSNVRINAANQTIEFTKPDANKLAEKHSEKHIESKRSKKIS